ncbi:NifU family protein [Rhizobium cremeum]|uniref:NifU family protein n=1 Tax=Rhizobium cremeum TaxID=2813827 RepID=UPI0039E06D37
MMHEQARTARITLFDGLAGRSSRPTATPQPIGPRGHAPPSQPLETADRDALALRAALLASRKPLIEAALEAIRPNLKRDGGDCQLVRLDGDAVYIRLSGACVGCQLAAVTVNGVRQKLIEAVGMPLRVIPVN